MAQSRRARPAAELLDVVAKAADAVGNGKRDEVLDNAARLAALHYEFNEALTSAGPFQFRGDSSGLIAATTQIDQAATTLGTAADVIVDQGRVSKDVRITVESASRELEEGIRAWIKAGKDGIQRGDLAQLNVLSAFEERLEARRFVEEAQDARDQAVRVLSSTQHAAGATGSASLAVHFGRYASREKRTADRLRAACVLVLLGITALAGILLVLEPGEDLSTTRELGRLSLTIPLAVLAAYLGREATRHRRTARWARDLEVQLQTVEAYTEPLTQELRDDLRSALGKRVFSAGPEPADGSDNASPSVVGETTGLLDGLANVLKSARGS